VVENNSPSGERIPVGISSSDLSILVGNLKFLQKGRGRSNNKSESMRVSCGRAHFKCQGSLIKPGSGDHEAVKRETEKKS